MAQRTYTLEIYRFRYTGKYYDDIGISLEVDDSVIDKTSLLLDYARCQKFDRREEFIWYLTGKGLPHEVPRLLL